MPGTTAISTEFQPLSEEERGSLHAFFDEGAAKFNPLDAYWIDGNDDGEDYCLACAQTELSKEIARHKRLTKAKKRNLDKPSLGGGYRRQHDCTPFCAKCSALLDGSLTEYGCESELEHFLENGFDITSDEDRRAMAEVINGRGWTASTGLLHLSNWEKMKEEKYFSNLHALGKKILEQVDAALTK